MDNLQAIHQQTLSRYSQRYHQLGKNIRTLGWGSKKQQYARFEQLLRLNIDFKNKHIADIGCGFGDLAIFLREKEIDFSLYTGLDINPDLLQEAKLGFDVSDPIQFFEAALPNWPDALENVNIGIMLGVLNVNLKSAQKNQDYSYHLIESAFRHVDTALVVDFLSTELSSDYPEEDFVFYHNPADILRFALKLSPKVRLFHDYAPIPQREFMLVLIKETT